jgi:hypothetical protein
MFDGTLEPKQAPYNIELRKDATPYHEGISSAQNPPNYYAQRS